MIEFIEYGALGIVAFSIWFDKVKTNRIIENNTNKTNQVIENNTIAMTKFYEIAKQCKR